MADLIVAVRSILLADSNVAAAVGSKVYTDQLPQAAIPPSVVIYIDNERAHDSLEGFQGFDSAEVRIESYGAKRPDADQLGRLVRNALSEFVTDRNAGTITGIVDGVFLQSIGQRAGQKQQTVRIRAGSDRYQWVARRDYQIGHSTPVEV